MESPDEERNDPTFANRDFDDSDDDVSTHVSAEFSLKFQNKLKKKWGLRWKNLTIFVLDILFLK